MAVEEGVHATQMFVDLGNYFKKGTPGNYTELSRTAIKNIFNQVANSSHKTDANYDSQRNEIEAKKIANKAASEIK